MRTPHLADARHCAPSGALQTGAARASGNSNRSSLGRAGARDGRFDAAQTRRPNWRHRDAGEGLPREERRAGNLEVRREPGGADQRRAEAGGDRRRAVDREARSEGQRRDERDHGAAERRPEARGGCEGRAGCSGFNKTQPRRVLADELTPTAQIHQSVSTGFHRRARRRSEAAAAARRTAAGEIVSTLPRRAIRLVPRAGPRRAARRGPRLMHGRRRRAPDGEGAGTEGNTTPVIV